MWMQSHTRTHYWNCTTDAKTRLQRSRVLIGNQDDESLTLLLWVEMLTGVYGKSALAGAPDN